jgi:hypothetical protein
MPFACDMSTISSETLSASLSLNQRPTANRQAALGHNNTNMMGNDYSF